MRVIIFELLPELKIRDASRGTNPNGGGKRQKTIPNRFFPKPLEDDVFTRIISID